MKKHFFYIPVLMVFLGTGCAQEKNEMVEEAPVEFNEPHRPQYHFSPPTNWMNDPNGMVYLDGEYHLFYQHYPDSNVWGPMHWGHAVSEDMIHWEHLPIALYPDSLGYIFSGSAVIDHGNTSGLGEEDKPPMIAIYTYHHNENGQSQGIAFSNDKGRTWEKFEGNPVLESPGIPDFRDPKVSWYEEGEGEGKWIMTLAVKDRISFYSSPDLINWTHESDFNPSWAAYGGVWECPDLFSLTDKDGNEKWVLLVSINPGGPLGGSATQYFTGEFDGSNFTSEGQEVKWLDHGADNYAGVTWANIPEQDGRRLFIGWMSNWQYANIVPTEAWRSAMTLPRELELFSKDGQAMVASRPVKEVENLREESISLENNQAELTSELLELSLTKTPGQDAAVTFSNKEGDKLTLQLQADRIILDRGQSGHTDFHNEFGKIHETSLNGLDIQKVRIFLDRSSIEIFLNDGEMVMTEIIFPTAPYSSLLVEGFEENGQLHYFKSIWNQ